MRLIFDKKKVLVVGDIMLDIYYQGEIDRISPEAPVPVFKHLKDRYVLGGAANVAANIAVAGQDVAVASVVGNDENGWKLKEMLHTYGISTEMLVYTDKVTTAKTRFLANNNQQVMRLDDEDIAEISTETENELIFLIEKKIKEFDIVLISDYKKGLLTYRFTREIIKLFDKTGIKVVADIKDNRDGRYNGIFLIKPNKKELSDISGYELNTDEDISKASKDLLADTACDYILTTLGAKGMLLVGKDDVIAIPSVARDVFDVTGAGDTAISYLAVCLANDYEISDAVKIANIASGIEVGKVGTSQVKVEEIEAYLIDKPAERKKVISSENIPQMKNENNGKRIVFTNGCFDILHVGHIRYLKEAKQLGDILIVGVNSDASVKHLKGNSRPVNTLEDRMETLAALECIDYVISFEEDTPYKLIKEIQPDILVKGGDYKKNDVVGLDIVEGNGGEVIIIPFVEGKSTTGVIRSILKIQR